MPPPDRHSALDLGPAAAFEPLPVLPAVKSRTEFRPLREAFVPSKSRARRLPPSSLPLLTPKAAVLRPLPSDRPHPSLFNEPPHSAHPNGARFPHEGSSHRYRLIGATSTQRLGPYGDNIDTICRHWDMEKTVVSSIWDGTHGCEAIVACRPAVFRYVSLQRCASPRTYPRRVAMIIPDQSSLYKRRFPSIFRHDRGI